MKLVVSSVKIQSPKETSYITLMENCQTFYSHIFVFVYGSSGLLLLSNSKVQGECITSEFDYKTLNSMLGGDYL